MLKKLVAVLIVAMMSFVGTNAFAKAGGKKMMHGKGKVAKETGVRMHEGGGDHFLKMLDMLELSGEQKKAVETLHRSHRKEVIRKEADVEVAEIELQEITSQTPINMDEAETKVRTIATLRADLEIMHLKTKEAIKAKLTTEQLATLHKLMAAARQEKCEEMGGMGPKGCKMGGKSEKCKMMGDNPGGMKGGDDQSSAKGKEEMGEHSHHH